MNDGGIIRDFCIARTTGSICVKVGRSCDQRIVDGMVVVDGELMREMQVCDVILYYDV